MSYPVTELQNKVLEFIDKSSSDELHLFYSCLIKILEEESREDVVYKAMRLAQDPKFKERILKNGTGITH